MPKRFKRLNSHDYLEAYFQHQKLMFAATETIWHRSFQLATGQMTTAETVSMWWEKPTAFAAGFEKACLAAVKGKSLPEVMQAGFAPMTAKASSNAKRLR